jgi:O-acetyl-ADP-ribose deacetylase (regulator of RNase III)/ketosteroid isomerase-like protein
MVKAEDPGEAARSALGRVEVVVGDITRQDVDAIVNAANEALAGGGGVDGAIHAAAGPELLAACRTLPEVAPGVPCPTGDARITPGFRLRARHVIHTVGPVWHGGRQGEPALLASCYRRAVELVTEHGLASLAFPAISTGVFGYPLEAASAVAIDSLGSALAEAPSVARVVLVAFSEPTARALREALAARRAASPVDVVHAWLAASNAAAAERLVELSAPDIEIIGPRGTARGHDVLREWLARAGARFETERVFSAGDRVVVEQHGVWQTPDGQHRGEAKLASRFVVRAGRVQQVQRYDSLREALADAGLPVPG